jgi:Tfp pilus assembly protein PilZ
MNGCLNCASAQGVLTEPVGCNFDAAMASVPGVHPEMEWRYQVIRRSAMAAKTKGNQTNRSHQRRTSYIIAEYTVREGVFRDIIKNIGANGLFVSTKRPVALNQEIVIKFPLFQFDHVIQATGRIVRCTANGFAVVFNEPIEGLICKKGEFPKIVHEIDRIKAS